MVSLLIALQIWCLSKVRTRPAGRKVILGIFFGLTTEYRATFPTILIEVVRWLGSRFQGIIQMARWLVSRFQGILFKWLVGSAVDSQGILFKWLVGSAVDSQGILFKGLIRSSVDSQV